MQAIIKIIPKIFRIVPVFAMSDTLRAPKPKIMALGGVETGSINAQDAERVAGIIKNNGFDFILTLTPATMGSII